MLKIKHNNFIIDICIVYFYINQTKNQMTPNEKLMLAALKKSRMHLLEMGVTFELADLYNEIDKAIKTVDPNSKVFDK